MSFKKIFNFILIVLLVFAPIILSLLGENAAASISLISISLGLAFWNMDKFSEFRGAGFVAKLNAAVDEAYAAIEEVRSVAVNLFSPVISLMAVKDPFQYLKLENKLEKAESISDSLKVLGVKKERISELLSTIYNRVERDHICKAIWAINEKLPTEKTLVGAYDDIDPSEWSADQIQKKAKELGVDITDELKDLKFFQKQKKLRNPEDWQG